MADLAVPQPGVSHRALIRPAHLVAVASAGAVVVLAVALIASASSLHSLGVSVGLSDRLAWSLPVTLDASAVFASVLWFFGPAGRVRAQARVITLSALGGTLAGNEVSHLVERGIIGPGVVLVLSVGAVAPLVAAGWAHLVATLIASLFDASAEAGDASLMPQGGPDASSGDSEASADASIAAPLRRRRSTLAQRQRWMHRQLEAGADLTGAVVEEHFGSRNGARELRRVLALRATSQFDVQAVSSPG